MLSTIQEGASLSLKRKVWQAHTSSFHTKQFVRIKRKAGDMPISTYIREGALHAIVRQPVSKELMKEIRDLNNLGTNINTLVKLAHQIGLMTIADKANEALDGVNSVLHQARLKIKEKEDEQEIKVKLQTRQHMYCKYFMEHHSVGLSTTLTTHAKCDTGCFKRRNQSHE